MVGELWMKRQFIHICLKKDQSSFFFEAVVANQINWKKELPIMSN
jgi:hypothetical protein